MGTAAGVAALLAAAMVAAQPVQEHLAEDTTHPLLATPPANKSEEAPAALVEGVMQLVLDVSRLTMEMYRSGGSRLVTARRLSTADEPSLLITFHRSAEAAAASLEPKPPSGQQTSQPTSQPTVTTNREDVGGRAVDYESSAEASLSDPLQLSIKSLPPPVVPRVDPMPLEHGGDGSSNVEVRHDMAARSRINDTVRGGRTSTKGAEISQRSAEVDKAHRMVLALVSGHDGTSGLRLLSRFLTAVNRAVDAVKKLVTSWRGDGSGEGGGVGGSRLRDVWSKQAPAPEDLSDRVASQLEATEHASGANPAEAPGR